MITVGDKCGQRIWTWHWTWVLINGDGAHVLATSNDTYPSPGTARAAGAEALDIAMDADVVDLCRV